MRAALSLLHSRRWASEEISQAFSEHVGVRGNNNASVESVGRKPHSRVDPQVVKLQVEFLPGNSVGSDKHLSEAKMASKPFWHS